MRRIVFVAATLAALSASMAQAQTAGSSAPSGQPSISTSPSDFSDTSLDRQTNYRRLDDEVAGSSRLLRQFPARLKDIKQGLEVRDAEGLVVGTIAKVANGFAVVASASGIGTVEVDVGSFARNKTGLLINLPKAKIDAMMTRAAPAG